jgi:ABC-2 type transport system permease protein
MLQRLWTLVLKELALALRDPQSRRMLVIPVVLQLALFPFAATMEVKNAPLAILNEDAGAASVELIERLARTQAFPAVHRVADERALAQSINDQDALIALRFPADFSRRLAAGQAAEIAAYADGRRSNSAQIAYAYVDQVVTGYAAERAVAAGHPPTSRIVVRNAFNPNLEYQWFILPSLVAIMTTIGALIVTALSLAREKEQGTLEQLLVSPLTPGYILLGKTVPALLVALFQSTLIVLAAVFVYGVPLRGSVALLYLGMACYALSLAGFGLLISTLCSTQQQAFLGVFSFMIPALMLSGFLAPVENMPPLLITLSWGDPLRHFIALDKGLFLKAYDFELIWPHLWPLLVIALASFGAAYAMFRRRIG